ncbi:MAG: baseplate J/gp47 family protein [Desulfobacterales bacterium]|nr:baseplate J/gp47 family protein [Desulfobacterales bacterium]
MDNLLTSVVKGVSAESHPFPPADAQEAPYVHSLERSPAADIIAVYGSRNGQSHAFVKDKDYVLSEDGTQLQWMEEGAQLPDKGTVFHVNYLPKSATGTLSDIHVGSVLRTLAESVGLEIARLYAQLEAVYKSAYIDTATGRALDNVVALLGTQRVKAGRFNGEMEFSRTPGSRGSIYIPAGTRVMTVDGNVEYETTASITVRDGQNTARVIARDVEENTQGVAANELTVLAKPITGIVSVTNPAPTAVTNADETDDELKTRAKNFLHGSERATLGAIKEAVAKQGILADVEEVERDLFDAEDNQIKVKVGQVKVIPHVDKLEPELSQRINTAISDSRPVGVNVFLDESVKAPTKVDLCLRIVTSMDLLEQDLRAVQDSVREKISDYFSSLPINKPGSVNRIIGLVLGINEIQDIQIVEAKADGVVISEEDLGKGQLGLADKTTQLGTLEIIDPNLPTLLRVMITHPENQDPPNPPQIENALNTMIAELNDMNDTEEVDNPEKQVLNFSKLLYVLPLPEALAKPQGSIHDVWTGPIPAGLTPGDIGDYGVQFVFTMESGLSQTLVTETDNYRLTAYERLSLVAVKINTVS